MMLKRKPTEKVIKKGLPLPVRHSIKDKTKTGLPLSEKEVLNVSE